MLKVKSLILFLFLLSPGAFSQTTDSVLNRIMRQVDLHGKSHDAPDLFLHIDKSIYVHNETIWFTAYLLNDNANLAQHHTLYALLVDPSSKKLISSDRFVLQKGFANGYLFLADSLQAGEYLLIAYTNTYIENEKQKVFKQRITLNSAQKSSFSIDLLPNYSYSFSDSLKFLYKIVTSYGGIASGGDFTYQLFDQQRLYESGKKKIDAFGEVTLTFPKTIAADKLDMVATVNRKKDTQTFRIPVFIKPKQVSVKFYPEGGNLVNNRLCRVALEIKGVDGKAVATKGVLLEDGQSVSSFESNLYGQGSFFFVPDAGKKYKVKLDQVDDQQLAVHNFPPILPSGYTIRTTKGIINDTIRLEIYAPQPKTECIVMAHNYRSVFYCYRISLAGDRAVLNIPTDAFPKGITTVTLFDAQGLPQAERAVYLPPSQVNVQIQTDSVSYHKRSRVNLKISVTDDKGKGIFSLFSIASIFSKRLDSTRFKDIVEYNYFDKYLQEDNIAIAADAFENKQYLEAMLLTRFWTRYKLNETTANNVLVNSTPLNPIIGYVLHNGKRLKKPVEMMLFGKKTLMPVITDSSGYFDLSPELLIDSAGGHVLLSVVDNKAQRQHEYVIKLQESNETVNKNLSSTHYTFGAIEKDILTAEEKEGMKSMLKQVVVKAQDREDFFAVNYIDKDCSAFVCACDHWMCNGCQPPRKPTLGQRYLNRQGGGYIIYMGCPGDEVNPFIKKIKATYISKEFYVADYEKYPPPLPEVLTTLFWSGLVSTDNNGEATFSFFTNDLTGRFFCILQGVSSQRVISGKSIFRVTDDSRISD